MTKSLTFYAILILFILTACGPKSLSLKNKLSSPAHHVEVGMVLFEKDKLAEAAREFQLALEMEPKLGKAHIGLALVEAKRGNKKKAWQEIEKAEALVKDKADEVSVNIGKIRLVYLLFSPEDLPLAEEVFTKIMAIKPGNAQACFYMALVYERAFLFDKALSLLDRVLKSENTYVLQAYNEIDKLTKIKQAHPVSDIGKEIGLKDAITRADMAALLVHELHLPELLEVPHSPLPVIRDIGTEPFAEEITAIVPLQLRELSATVDGYFDPQLKITKASLCEILEDILVRILGDNTLRHRFKKVRSPYKDLDPKAPYYNACILGLVKGFVTPQDYLNKEFGPLSPVSGADVLLGLKRLREEAKII
ncbi:MAG: hypothetical protein J7M03_03935 [Candidatus Desulfofervidaceae bacterium]|nr:hypothetical protein [Candidatus Desulfofervidaceae bacterium]MDL1970825.1 hypothetical protein [Candidatus Desulfofervidaceae bacterium]